MDLGSTRTINRVVLNWETAYGKAYQIQVSNDAQAWTTIYTTTNGDGGTDDLTVSGSGRYVRMYGTTRGTQWGLLALGVPDFRRLNRILTIGRLTRYPGQAPD